MTRPIVTAIVAQPLRYESRVAMAGDLPRETLNWRAGPTPRNVMRVARSRIGLYATRIPAFRHARDGLPRYILTALASVREVAAPDPDAGVHLKSTHEESELDD